MAWVDEAKRKAAIRAVQHVKDGYVVGLGSGSTAEYAIKELAKKMRGERLLIRAVSSSHRTAAVAKESGIPLISLDEVEDIDVAIDGADQVDPQLNLIKGRGGALMREKVIDSLAKEFLVVADESKLTDKLGLGVRVPIEVLPFSAKVVMKRIEGLGGRPELRMADGKSGKVEPVLTDNGNHIVDVNFGRIDDPRSLDVELRRIPGVLETGLFVEMVHLAYIGCRRGVKVIRRKKT